MQIHPFKAAVFLLLVVCFTNCAGKKPGGGGGGGGEMGGGGGCRPGQGAGEARPDGRDDLLAPAGSAEEGLDNGQGLFGQADPPGFNTPQPGVGIVPSGILPGNDFTAPIASEPGSDAPPTLDADAEKADPPGSQLRSFNDPNPNGPQTAPQPDPKSAVQTVRFNLGKNTPPTSH